MKTRLLTMKSLTIFVILFTCYSAVFATNIAMIGNNDALKKELSLDGYKITAITEKNLFNKEIFNINTYDILLVTESDNLPQECAESLLSFLRKGGDLILLGGHAFKNINFEKSLPVFYDDETNYFNNTAYLKRYDSQKVTQQKWEIELSGINAIGYSIVSTSRYIPLLEVYNKNDVPMGFAAGMLIHYNGEFEGGRWFISGVYDGDFYKTPVFINTLKTTLKKVAPERYIANMKLKDKIARQDRLKPVPGKMQKIIISDDGRSLTKEDGQPFFIIGTNYIGTSESKCSHMSENFILENIRKDFERANKIGINCFRFWIEGLDNRLDRLESVIALAQTYDIYLLLQPTAHPMENIEDLSKLFSDLAKCSKSYNAVIGFDLMNEPYITTVGSVMIDCKPGQILAENSFDKYKDSGFYNKEWVLNKTANRNGWPEMSKWVTKEQARNLYASFDIAKQYSEKFIESKDYSSLQGIEEMLPFENEYEVFFNNVNTDFSNWINIQKTAIKKQNDSYFITVGYNTSLTALPANKSLDIVSHHLYQPPSSYEDMVKSVTTFDRLQRLYPDKPITLGEFGYSSYFVLPNGEFLGDQTSSVAEMMIYLYAFANNYSGAMSWMLSDWPVPIMERTAWWISKKDQTYQAGFGLFRYNGTDEGKPKPIATAIRIFSQYIKNTTAGKGRFEIHRSSKSPIGCGYSYKSKDALFIGDIDYSDANLNFTSPVMTNLMIIQSSTKLELTSSTNLKINMNLKCFSANKPENFKKIELLAGQTKTIEIKE